MSQEHTQYETLKQNIILFKESICSIWLVLQYIISTCTGETYIKTSLPNENKENKTYTILKQELRDRLNMLHVEIECSYNTSLLITVDSVEYEFFCRRSVIAKKYKYTVHQKDRHGAISRIYNNMNFQEIIEDFQPWNIQLKTSNSAKFKFKNNLV